MTASDDEPPDGGGDGAPEPVGYRKPPKAHRFKPGRSGNPRGRPKKSRNLLTEAADILGERFPVGAGRKRVSAQALILLKQREKAIKGGDPRAAALMLALSRDIEERDQARAAEAETEAREAEDRALIEAALQRLKPKDEAP